MWPFTSKAKNESRAIDCTEQRALGDSALDLSIFDIVPTASGVQVSPAAA
jgi:hypothetical protein